jgi:excinuclease ABC subunit A
MEVIKCADHIIDLGVEAGAGGGNIVFEGTPAELTKCEQSHTAKFLELKVKN